MLYTIEYNKTMPGKSIAQKQPTKPIKCMGRPIEPFLSCLFFCMYFFVKGKWFGEDMQSCAGLTL